MAAAKPLILIMSSQTTYLDEPAFRLCENYADAVIYAGGLPVAAPIADAPGVYDDLLARADGLLLTGGADIDPALYRSLLAMTGEEVSRAERSVGRTTPLRDAMELHALEVAESRAMPILGICRGAQLMNVAHGGTLYHDLATQTTAEHGAPLVHDAHMDGRLSHEVSVSADTLLARIVGAGALEVNSLHHQAVRDVGEGLVVSAAAPDGVIEAVENPALPFALGVQWHPEYAADREPMSRIFRAFVGACAQGVL